MSKHTKSPWTAEESVVFANPDNGPKCGVVVASCADGDGNETTLANARLIAAAPELLEALIALYEAAPPEDCAPYLLINDYSIALELAYRTIKKAEGEYE